MTRRLMSLLLCLWLSGGALWSQSEDASVLERTYPFSMDAVQKALQRIGGFGGGKNCPCWMGS